MLFAIIGLLPTALSAQTPPELRDLVGARGSSGETQLKARGYRFVRLQEGDDRKWSYYWNPANHQCVTVATYDGRYDAITSSPAPDCGEAERAGDAHHGSDDRGRHPDIGFGRPAPTRESPSFAAAGTGYVEVQGQQVELGLVCFGDGQRSGVVNSNGWTWDRDKDRYVYGNRVDMTAQQFDASVMIQLWPGGGRIKLPKKLIPPIHSRGDGAWWDIYDVSLGRDVISGAYRLNGLNKPKLTINRTSGQISIVGTAPYAFRGTCDLIDGHDHRRF
ncbi:hypothetical protein [Novosphingobium kaempferiae]|uniref:hypothetical protein n=1 Tax=Novosphingobium kaempferiae TaxID=2896849 RepID=UPI001E5847B6|nr:hypothetical protein [Novosphingobium kaempferiae]